MASPMMPQTPTPRVPHRSIAGPVVLILIGVLFLLGIPFLGLRSRELFLWAAGWALVAPLLSHAFRHEFPSTSEGGFGVVTESGRRVGIRPSMES